MAEDVKGKKISELDEVKNNLVSDDLLLVSRNDNSYKVSYNQVKNSISNDIKIINIKNDIIGIQNVIGENGSTITNMQSNIVENKKNINDTSSFTNQLALSVDEISSTVKDILIEAIPLATENVIGGIKVGFAETDNKFAVNLSTDGKAYVNVDGYNDIKELPSVIDNHELSLINVNHNIEVLSDSLSSVTTEMDAINLLSSRQTDTIDFLYNLQSRLYDSQFRNLNTSISQSALVSVLIDNDFDINDNALSTIFCTYEDGDQKWSISSNVGRKTTSNVSIDFSYERNSPNDSLYPVNGDVVAYSRNISEENASDTAISDLIWYRDTHQSYICKFNNSGEISCLSAKINQLSSGLSGCIDTLSSDLSAEIRALSVALSTSIKTLAEKSMIVYNQAFFGESQDAITINMLNVVDVAKNSFIRLKIANLSNENATATINDVDFDIEPYEQKIDDRFNTVDSTEQLKVSNLDAGLQLNVIIYENGYPIANMS